MNRNPRTRLILSSTIANFINSSLRINQNCCSATIHRKSICTNANSSIIEPPSVEATLISIFTNQPLSLQSTELQQLSSSLNPQIVQTVLKSFRDWKIAEVFFKWASNQEGYFHSCYAYNAMADVLSTARQNDALKNLSSDVLNSRTFWTAGAVGYFLRCLGSQGLVKEANYFFDQANSNGLCVLNNYSYNCLLEVISDSGDVKLMECRLNEMRNMGWSIDKHTLTPVLRCYCNAREFEKASMVFNELKKNGWIDQHVLTILVLAYSKCGEVDKAFNLIGWSESNLNIHVNEKTMFVLVHGFVRECRVDKALQLYGKMKKMGFRLDISIYDVLISGLCKNKDIKKLLMVYSQMMKSKISPDARIFLKILSCNLVEKDMIRLLEDSWKILDARKRELLYNSVLASFVNNGFPDRACHLLKAATIMIKEKPKPSFFEAVIDGLCKIHKLDTALDIFHDMARHGHKRSVLMYNNLIMGLSSTDRLDKCFDLLNEMESEEFQPTHFTFNTLLGCICEREDVEGALDLLKEMRTRGHQPWIKHCTLLVKKLCDRGKPVEARNFLYGMTSEGFLPDLISYSATMNGFFNTNRVDEGLELFKEIREKGYCPDVVAYNIIIKGLCRAKKIQEAEELLNDMLSKGLVPSVVTYNLLIDGWCKEGDVDRAIVILSRMIEEEQDPSVITYTSLVAGLCNSGKPEDAVAVWAEMRKQGCDPNPIAYMAFINGLCKCRKPDVALTYLEEMEAKKMRPDNYIYKTLAEAFLYGSNAAMASKLLRKMTNNIKCLKEV